MRTDLRTREQQDVSPQPKRNDGGPVGELKYRFNWNAPIVPSPHDKNTVYFGSNVVFKTTDFGKTWDADQPGPDHQRSGEAEERRHDVDREHHGRISLHGDPHRRIARCRPA